MNISFIEYFIVISILVTVFLTSFRRQKKQKLTTVKDLRYKCSSQEQKLLYDVLTRRGFYVSPEVQCGSFTIPIALVPFQFAIFVRDKKGSILKKLFLRHKLLYVKSNGWKVLTVSKGLTEKEVEGIADQIILSLKNNEAL